jgi:hypothetical protein
LQSLHLLLLSRPLLLLQQQQQRRPQHRPTWRGSIPMQNTESQRKSISRLSCRWTKTTKA